MQQILVGTKKEEAMKRIEARNKANVVKKIIKSRDS